MLQKKLGSFRIVVGIAGRKEHLIWNVLVSMRSGMFHKRRKQPDRLPFTGINNVADVALERKKKKKTSLESLTVISNQFFPVIVLVAALTILGQMVFRVRQEPAPCAWARGSTEGLTGCENWPSDIEELKRSTTHTRIMSEVRSHNNSCMRVKSNKEAKRGAGLITHFHFLNAPLRQNLGKLDDQIQTLGSFLY